MRPLRVAWISSFPVERWPGCPAEVAALHDHPASWQRVLLAHWHGEPQLELHVFALRKNLRQPVRWVDRNITFHALPVPPLVRATTAFWWDTVVLRRELARIQPDLVHAWGMERGAAVVAARQPFPSLVTLQGIFSWYIRAVRPTLYQRGLAALEDRCLRRGPQVTVESHFAADYLQSRHPALHLHRIEHAPDPGFPQVKREPALAPPVLLSVGWFHPNKGADLLLDAVTILRAEGIDLHLRILGNVDPALVPALDVLQRAGVVEACGMVSASEVMAAMASATLMVFPTRVDNSPNAVKEAVVAGVPVVASAVGGIPDYVRPGYNGTLIGAPTATALAEALRTTLAHPVLGRGRVDSATLASLREELSTTRMGEQFLHAYRATVASAATSAR